MTPVNWQKMPAEKSHTGILTFYYSSDKAEVPTRGVDKLKDHKRDPNFETRTYGLFTDCNQRMRKAAVREGRNILFFMTSWRGRRYVTGFMRIGWFAEVTLNENLERGYALKADRMFLAFPPLPFFGNGPHTKFNAGNISYSGIVGSGPLRGAAKLDQDSTLALINALMKRRMATNQYIRELHRLEDENLKRFEYRYPDIHKVEQFSESDIKKYLF